MTFAHNSYQEIRCSDDDGMRGFGVWYEGDVLILVDRAGSGSLDQNGKGTEEDKFKYVFQLICE